MPKAMTSTVVPVQNVTAVVPLLMVTNMERSLAFYVAGLRFTIEKRWIPDGRLRWCWMSLGGAALMLQEAVNSSPEKIAAAGVLGKGVSLNFQCSDALAIYRDAAARGIVSFARGAHQARSLAIYRDAAARGIPALREPQVGNFAWEIGFADPDGYRIHFSSPTDLPEETLLSDIQA